MKLHKTVLSVALAAVLPPCANALEIGEMTVHSESGQPLRASVPIQFYADNLLGGAIDSPLDPATVSYTLKQTDSGAVLDLSTTTPVTEPFKVCLTLDDGLGQRQRIFRVTPQPRSYMPLAINQVTVDAAVAEPVPTTTSTQVAKVDTKQTHGSILGFPVKYIIKRLDTLTGIATTYRVAMGGNQFQRVITLYDKNRETGVFENDDPNLLSQGAEVYVTKVTVSKDEAKQRWITDVLKQ